MVRVLILLLKVLGTIIVAVPLLFLATCTYTSFSPHLRSDPLLLVLMDAPRDAELGWRTADVALVPAMFQQEHAYTDVLERLDGSGFKLFADYSTNIAPRDRYPEDGMPQAGLDKMFAQAKVDYNALGITHIFERIGRTKLACGESLFVELGFTNQQLTKATGYSRWTCL